ncbi:hypothetical protein HDU96_003292, partial [Phlyctochytrium bullatum]
MSSFSAKLSTMAVAAKEKGLAAAAVAKEKGLAAAAVAKERAVVISADVSVRAKEAYAAAKRSELYEKGASYFAGKKEPDRKSADPLSYPTIFGMSLEEVLERTRLDHLDADIPPLVYRCIEYINVSHLNEVGLYRVSGSATEVNQLKALFSIGGDVDLFELKADPNAVCSVLKAFLRELPEPLLTSKLLPDFQALFPSSEDAAVPTSPLLSTAPPILPTPSPPAPPAAGPAAPPLTPHVQTELRALIDRLPKPNADVLTLLMSHLDTVQQRSTENRMTIGNLAVIFSPTLQVNSALFRALVVHWEKLFGGRGRKDVSSLATSRPSPPPIPASIVSPSSPTAPASPQIRTRPNTVNANTASRVTSIPPPRPPLPKSVSSGLSRRSMGEKEIYGSGGDPLDADLPPPPHTVPIVPPRPGSIVSTANGVGPGKKGLSGARSIDSMIDAAGGGLGVIGGGRGVIGVIHPDHPHHHPRGGSGVSSSHSRVASFGSGNPDPLPAAAHPATPVAPHPAKIVSVSSLTSQFETLRTSSPGPNGVSTAGGGVGVAPPKSPGPVGAGAGLVGKAAVATARKVPPPPPPSKQRKGATPGTAAVAGRPGEDP